METAKLPGEEDDAESALPCSCAYCINIIEGKDFRWLRSGLWQLAIAGAMLVVAYVLRRHDHSASVRGNFVYRWAFLVALLVFVYVGGRIANWMVFKVVSLLALIPYLSDVMFYALALDGVVQHITWIVVGWTLYDSALVGLHYMESLENLFLLFLLWAVLATLRNAFLRHVLRDRLRAQYQRLSLRVMKAKSIIYRISMAAYGLPPPTYNALPRTLQYIESESRHKRAKRSYAEFNKLLSYAYGEGFLVHPNPFKSADAYVEMTSQKKMERLAEALFRKFYQRYHGIPMPDQLARFSRISAVGGAIHWLSSKLFWRTSKRGLANHPGFDTTSDRNLTGTDGDSVGLAQTASTLDSDHGSDISEHDLPEPAVQEYREVKPLGDVIAPESRFDFSEFPMLAPVCLDKLEEKIDEVIEDTEEKGPAAITAPGFIRRFSMSLAEPRSQHSSAAESRRSRSPYFQAQQLSLKSPVPRLDSGRSPKLKGGLFTTGLNQSQLKPSQSPSPAPPKLVRQQTGPQDEHLVSELEGAGRFAMRSPYRSRVGMELNPPPLMAQASPQLITGGAGNGAPPMARQSSTGTVPDSPAAVRKKRRYPSIPIEFLKPHLTTEVAHIPYDADKFDEPAERAEALFEYFCDMVDINADGNISARELQGGFVTMMKDWKSLKRSWSGHATVSKAYHVSTMIVGVLIAVVIWMLVFNVAIDSVLLPLGALAVASAYAIGGSITLLFQALLFVVLYSPYEVGDIVMIRSFGEETFDEGMLKVVDIAVSTTTLESQQGHVIQMSNAMLMSRKIVNLTRSGHATIVVKFTVGYHTSREQLNCFADKLKQYVRRHTVDWKPTVNMQVMSADVTGPMELEVVVQHVKTWKDQDEISVSRGKLIQAAIHYMIELNIHYVDVTSTDESKRRKLRIKEEDEDDNDINDAAMDMYR